MAKRSRIGDLLDQQTADLAALEDREVAAFVRAYEDARRELREKLAKVVVDHPDQQFTAQHLRVMLAQVESGLRDLRRRLQEKLEASTDKATKKALGDLLAAIKAAEPDFTDTGNRIEHQALRKIGVREGMLLHRHSIERYGEQLVSEIQRQMMVGLVSGETYTQLRDRITAVENSPFAQLRGRAELIVRMEMSAAYNGSHQDSIESAAEILDDPDDPDPMLKKADETRDVRNHALSRVLDGMVVRPKDSFKVPQAAVAAEHAKLQGERRAKKLPERKLGGITWPLVDGHYVGLHHPAHFADRGRIMPWRESWSVEPAKRTRYSHLLPPEPKPEPPAPPPPPPPPRHTVILHEKQGGPAGSNQGGFYLGSDGVRRYVKFYDDPVQAAGEHIANGLYRDLGLGGPKSELFEAPDGRLAYASELLDVEGTLGEVLRKRSADDQKALARKALDGFAADVLTANWDAAGLTLDNIVVDTSGNTHRIDNGGAFLARAKAGRKSQAALHGFEEWWRYFDSTNPGYYRLATTAGVERGHDLDIERQVAAIVELRDRAGGWDQYVKSTPGLSDGDRRAIVELLERRTADLEQKRADWNKLKKMDDIESTRPFGNSKGAAATWGNTVLKPARGTMTVAETRAVTTYTGGSYRTINRRLRDGDPPDADDRARDSAIDRSRLPTDLVLYRGERAFDEHVRVVIEGAKSESQVFEDQAYGSSALVPRSASSFAGTGQSAIVYRIYAPQGAPGLWVDDISQHPGEVEVLNPRNTRVRLLRIRWVPAYSHWVVDAEILPPS